MHLSIRRVHDNRLPAGKRNLKKAYVTALQPDLLDIVQQTYCLRLFFKNTVFLHVNHDVATLNATSVL